MADKVDFEQDLKRLKEIVSKIESNELPLNESIKLFEEGNKIIKNLDKSLKEAEKKVSDIINIDIHKDEN